MRTCFFFWTPLSQSCVLGNAWRSLTKHKRAACSSWSVVFGNVPPPQALPVARPNAPIKFPELAMLARHQALEADHGTRDSLPCFHARSIPISRERKEIQSPVSPSHFPPAAAEWAFGSRLGRHAAIIHRAGVPNNVPSGEQ